MATCKIYNGENKIILYGHWGDKFPQNTMQSVISVSTLMSFTQSELWLANENVNRASREINNSQNAIILFDSDYTKIRELQELIIESLRDNIQSHFNKSSNESEYAILEINGAYEFVHIQDEKYQFIAQFNLNGSIDLELIPMFLRKWYNRSEVMWYEISYISEEIFNHLIASVKETLANLYHLTNSIYLALSSNSYTFAKEILE